MKQWHLKNTYRDYTPEEVLDILREEHRLFSFIDCEVDDDMEITPEMLVYYWRTGGDFLPWGNLYKALNFKFKIDQSYSAWKKAIYPEKRKRIWDMCVFISQHAKKEVIHPIRILGKECLSAAIFLTLKQNLLNRGIEEEYLKPSTNLIPFLDKHFPYIITEILLTGAKTFDSLKPTLRNNISFWQKINIFNPNRYYIDTGSIKTFGDLSRKIALEYKISTD